MMLEIAGSCQKLKLQVTVDPIEEDSDESFVSTVQKLNTNTHKQSNSSKSPS